MGLIGEALSVLQEPVSAGQFSDTVISVLYREWKANFTQPQAQAIQDFVVDAYKTFRQAPDALASIMQDVPVPSLSITDFRVVEFYRQFDLFYLGKFITDTDTRKAIFEWLKDWYKEKGYTMSPDIIKEFTKAFPEVLAQEEWKIDRIVRTSMSRMRNTANLAYMDQAGVSTFQIIGLRDSKQCAYCARLYGKKFSVATALKRVTAMASASPEEIGEAAPFITSIYKKATDLDGLTSEDMELAGVGLPPYHGHCRCSVIAVL